jgi:NAD(P)-dependent dehydrogenase (short-subunit alcohol dehydrogenase family)
MARILITGSADGLGLLAAKNLASQKHRVTLHARSEARARDAHRALPEAERVVVGDLATLAGMRQVAEQANTEAPYDAVIHNAAIGYREPRRVETADGIEEVFAINVLAPYLLTALIARPKRLVYLTSGLHREGKADLADVQWKKRRWSGYQAYSDSKLYDVVLAFAVARRWPDVLSNSVEPGWVATKMGGPGAPDDLKLGAVTQTWLAVSDDAAAKVSGCNFYHQALREVHPATREQRFQDELLATCAALASIELPAAG